MAKGGDSEEFVVLSRVRAGLKRELAFALKVQSEICGSLGRTRSSRRVGQCFDDVGKGRRVKRLKKISEAKKEGHAAANEEKEEGEAKSDVVDALGDDLETVAEGRTEVVEDEIGGEHELGGGDLVKDLAKDDEMTDGGGVVVSVEEEAVRIDPRKSSGDDLCKNEALEERTEEVDSDMPLVDEPVCENMAVEEQRKKIDSGVTSIVEMVREDKPVEEKAESADSEKSLVDEPFSEVKPIEEKTQAIESETPLVDKAMFENKPTEEQARKFHPANAPVGETVAIPIEGINNARPGKPLKKFTRMVFRRKPETETLKKSETLRDEKLFEDKPMDEQTMKMDVSKPLVEEPVSKDEPSDDQVEKNDFTKPSLDEASETPVNDMNKAGATRLEKPVRRFTRSALKPKPEKAIKAAVENDAEERDINNRSQSVTLPAKVAKKFSNAGKKFPTKLKDLLETGILEGQLVRYLRGPKLRGTGDLGLQGVIRGPGIVCYCGSCKGKQVVTPTVFERHAGSLNKRPPEYIYLENGNTLRDVMNACQNFPLIISEEAVERVIGCSLIGKCSTCLNCKGSMPEVGTSKATLLCNLCVELKESQPNVVSTADNNNE